VVRTDGGATVYAPISGRAGTDGCELTALDAVTGDRQWGYHIPSADCAIHSVADPTVADYDSDGRREVLAATTENQLLAFDPAGDVELRYELADYGYTRPVVADVTGDDRPEVVVVDISGTVSVVRADGSTVWSRGLESYTWGQPAVVDVDGDGEPEVAVAAGGARELHLFEADGSPAWHRPVRFDSSLTWMTTAQADGDPGVELVVATAQGGRVAAVDGDGSRLWSRDLGTFAAVRAVADGDGDGTEEVYAVAEDAVLRSLEATTGRTEWATTLTDGNVQMTPPPSVGDVDDDGDPELVALTNDGIVALVDPESGEVLSSYEREDAIYAPATLADADGDGRLEAFVMYGRGRVVAVEFSE
jgi:outer membrane protein assembly factor BamB